MEHLPIKTGDAAPIPQSGTPAALPPPWTLAGRALRLRCPRCGAGGIFRQWVRMLPACPRCHLDFEQGEQGYIVGAYMLNIIAAELMFVGAFLAVLVATWPTPPWTLIQWVAPVLVVVVPVVTYPVSKTMFLAMHLAVMPLEGEPSPKQAG